jgi:hypothetical protein
MCGRSDLAPAKSATSVELIVASLEYRPDVPRVGLLVSDTVIPFG